MRRRARQAYRRRLEQDHCSRRGPGDASAPSTPRMVSGSTVKISVVRSIRDKSAVRVLHTTLLSVTRPLVIRSHKSGSSRSSWRKFLPAGDVVRTRPRPLLQHLPLAPIGQGVAGTAHLRMRDALGLVLISARSHALKDGRHCASKLYRPGNCLRSTPPTGTC